jgi:hypothetical protein
MPRRARHFLENRGKRADGLPMAGGLYRLALPGMVSRSTRKTASRLATNKTESSFWFFCSIQKKGCHRVRGFWQPSQYQDLPASTGGQ